MCVYCITHKATGMRYVGQTRGAAGDRWMNHIVADNNKQSRIKRAIKKHGRDAFDFAVIDIAETVDQLDHKERFWIEKLNTVSPNGYNLMLGGQSIRKFSEETIEKMRAAGIARHNGAISKRRARKMRTEEEKVEARKAHIAKMAESKRGKPTWLSTNGLTDAMVEKMRASKIGVPIPKKWKAIEGSDGSYYASLKEAISKVSVSIADVVRGRRSSLFGVKYWYKEI